MALDNPSYFTIPGGLNSGTQKPGRFSLLKRHARMGSTASNPSPPPGSPAGSRRAVPQERYSVRTASNSSTPPGSPAGSHRAVPQERYSSAPSSASVSGRRHARSAFTLPSKETQMLVLGMPRACDVAPHATHAPYRSSTNLYSSYYNLGAAPPSRRHSIGAYFVRKPAATLPRRRPAIAEEPKEKEEVLLGRPQDLLSKGSRPAGMEDIIIISSQKSQAAELWVTYLRTCFEQIRKNRDKPPFRILCITVEDLDDKRSVSPVLESKLRQARLEIVIMCPVFLDYVLQYPERCCTMTSHLQPKNVLAMLLGLEESSLTEQHRAALVSFGQWRKMESVKDRDESFVSKFLGAAMEILARTPTQAPTTPDKNQFMLIPKKVNQCQKKVVVLLTEPCEKEDTLLVSIVRNGEAVEVPGVSKRNPYTLAFRVPDVYLGLTALVGVRVTKNGRDLGCKQLKCESQLHALEQVLRVCDQPLDFTCQALNIVPTDKSKLDDMLVKAFQRNVPPNFNLLQSAGLGQVPRGAVSAEELPTLLHFAAKFGLEQLSWALLECPGGDAACELKNAKQLTPAEMADANGHSRLSNLLCGYMQMAQFSNAYAFLKGMVDGKQDDGTSEEYMNPRPVLETYQVPPCPRPCQAPDTPPPPLGYVPPQPPETPPPPHGYMPMRSPMGRLPAKPSTPTEARAEELSYSSRERLPYRSTSSEEASTSSEGRKKDTGGHGVEEELIEIINDFKNNVFTISEVEALVNQWRRRNDVQQSFREKQEHLTKLREEYERVQQRMKEGMQDVGRPSPMERIRNFFRGKPKEGKAKGKAVKKKTKDEGGTSSRPASSLSILSSSSSSSGRLSTASGGSAGDSGQISDPESERRCRIGLDNYDIPPSPVCLAVPPNATTLPPNAATMAAQNYDVPPSPVELLAACAANEYCNIDSAHHGKPGLKTVVEEEKKTDSNCYMNLPGEVSSGPLTIIEPEDICRLPEYVNVEAQGIQLKCN